MAPQYRLHASVLRLVMIVLVTAGLAGFPWAAHAGGQADFDVRGTWKTSTWSDTDSTRFRRTLVIAEQSASGDVRGSWDQHGEGATARMTGTITGSKMDLLSSKVSGSYVYTGTLRMRDGNLVWSGRWSHPEVARWRGPFTATLGGASPEGGTRPSATLVICNRDMTVASDQAVLQCTALVADASGQPGSATPTGKVAWESEAGRVAPGSCTLSGGGAGGVSWCAVSLAGTATELPIGAELPVTATYAGDRLYAPSEASHQLFGRATGYTETDQYGPGCNPAAVTYPSTSCGDPVNPATGNLSMIVADMGISGRGLALAVVRTYNAQAAATGAMGRFGAGWSDEHEAQLVRSANGKRVTVHLGTGATVPFTVKGERYEAPGWVTATLAGGEDKGYVLTLTDQTRFTFDGQGRLTSFADRREEPISLTRDAAGAILSASDSAGRALTFAQDAAGRVTQVTDPLGRAVRYAYDVSGHLTTVTDVAGGITRYIYDDAHRMTSIVDPRGGTATTDYDGDDRVIRQADPLGNVITFAYAGTYPNHITLVTDGKGVRDAYEYRNGMPFSEIRALGTDSESVTSHLYDADMRHIGTLDPNRGLWRIRRDAAGNVLTTTDPLGRTTTITWNERNDMTSVTSPLGLRSAIEYDDRGLVTRAIRAVGTPDEAVTMASRDDPEHPSDLTSTTDALGAVTRYEYDEAGNLSRVTDAMGGVTTVEVNALGWVMGVTGPVGDHTSITRDVRGQATSVSDPMGDVTTATWDAAGAITSMTDPLGSITSLFHDAAGRSSGAGLADGTSQAVERDELGDVIGQSDPAGAVTSRTYDPLRRVTSVADPLGNNTSATYDAASNVLSTTNALGQTTRFTWDAADQLLGIDYDDGTPDVAFTYDLDGRRTSMTDGTGTTTYEYDARDRTVAVTDGAGGTVRSTWDLRGALTGLVYSDGLTVSYEHDVLGRTTSVSDSVGNRSTFAYDAAGRLVSSTLGDGSVTSRTYDARGSLLSISGGPFDRAYERDPLGRVASIAAYGGVPVGATHDVRGRLTGLGEATMELNAAGALTSLRGATLTHDEAGRLGEMVSDAGTTTFTFDSAGRRVAQEGASAQHYAYDQAGRLTTVGSSTWTYDGDGVRRSAADASGMAQFSWLTAGGRPMLLSDGTSRFVYGPGGMPLVQVAADGTTLWMHTDQSGSVRVLTDGHGAAVGVFAFDAYGLPTLRAGTAETRLGFQGNYTEAGSGLQYLLARVYDPKTGQFLTVDPLVLRTLQPYAFASGDPLTYGDPTGLDITLAGHGGWTWTSGYTTVPEGTTVIFHTPPGWGMTDELGTRVERGAKTRFEERFGPGSLIPNYMLSPTDQFMRVLGTSRTVSSKTPLSDLLKPFQGRVHWAACRSFIGWGFDDKHPKPRRLPDDYPAVREHQMYWQRTRSNEDKLSWGVNASVVFGDIRTIRGDYEGVIADPVILLPGV